MATEHRVAPGECLSSIAYRYGFHPDTIWDRPENAGIRAQRRSMFQLVPGEDVVFIPDLRVRDEGAATGRVHRFRRRGVPEVLRIRLRDADGQPRAGIDYRLEIDGTVHEGQTAADGLVEHFIPNDAGAGSLTLVGTGEVYALALGHLWPVTEIRGVQQRLRNRGYYQDAPIDGRLGDATRSALTAFQRARGLEPTGEPDEATIAALDAGYGRA
jgi:N-acetylmuramoyl-L-alanine amidase